jgi:hypothetical protein
MPEQKYRAMRSAKTSSTDLDAETRWHEVRGAGGLVVIWEGCCGGGVGQHVEMIPIWKAKEPDA